MPNHPLGQHSSLLLPGKELKQLSGLLFSFIGNVSVARGLRLYAKEYSQEENNKEKENGSTHSQTHKEFCKGENKWSALSVSSERSPSATLWSSLGSPVSCMLLDTLHSCSQSWGTTGSVSSRNLCNGHLC